MPGGHIPPGTGGRAGDPEKSGGVRLSFTEADPELAVSRKRGIRTQGFDYKNWKDVEISLAGEYQFGNAALALETVEALREQGHRIPDESVYRGMKNAFWPARFMVIGEDPLFIMDGAHNRDAAQKLFQTVSQVLKGRRIVGIMGMLADKEYDEVVKTMAPCMAQVFTVTPPEGAAGGGPGQERGALRPSCTGLREPGRSGKACGKGGREGRCDPGLRFAVLPGRSGRMRTKKETIDAGFTGIKEADRPDRPGDGTAF